MRTRSGLRFAIGALVVGFGPASPMLLAGTIYTVVNLGTIGGGGGSSFAEAINASGEVAGGSAGSTFPTGQHAFLYDGTMHDLGTLGGPNDGSQANAINGSGSTAGGTTTPSGYHAFLYDGSMHDLGTFGGTYSVAWGINSNSQVVGGATDASGNSHAFVYDGSLHDIGTLGGGSSQALGINDSGLIVGQSSTAGDAAYHAFLFDGTMHDLGTLGLPSWSSIARSVNGTGEVVGNSGVEAPGGAFHAFLYDGSMHDLGTLGGGSSYALGINDAGVIVGDSMIVGDPGPLPPGTMGHAFIYYGGMMEDLNDLVGPNSGWVLNEARAINDAGQIAGVGVFNGQDLAFRLDPVTPTPEPSAFGELTLILAATFLMARREKYRQRR